jgi:hypothetical protein
MERPKQTINIETIKPHSLDQEIIMRAFLQPGLREVFVACGTKYGKSLSASTALTNGVIKKRGGTFRWLAPIYRQTNIGMGYFKNIAPPPPHTEIIQSKMLMRFPELKSEIEFWHTQRPVDLEGAAVQGQVGDEAAKMPFDAYVAANTTTTFTKALSMWISTPYGKGWFYKKYMEAKDHMEWSLARGKTPIKIAIHAPTSANPLIDPAIIEQARQNLPDRMFRQYYLAEFLDDGAVFVNFRNCVQGRELYFEGDMMQWFHHEASTQEVVIGVDWAKHTDYSVFVAIAPNSNPRRVVGFMRFHGLSYTLAIKELYHFTKKFGSIGLIVHDKTGVGEAIDDMLAPIPLPFKGLTFTNPLKSNLVNTLGMAFEKQEIEIPNWPELLKELDTFEVVINKLGTTVYNASQGNHDDIIIALALANKAATEYAGEFDIKYLEELENIASPIDKYYSDMIDDDEDDLY